MSRIKFSIIVPVHNGMPHIQQCIQSILNQDYQDFNILILENASTDGTSKYLKSLDDKRITIIPSSRLLSIEENWSRILNFKCNEYISIVMADDYVRSDFLSVLSRTILRHPNHPIYRTNITAIDACSKVIYKSQIKTRITIYDYLKGRLTHTYFETAAGYCIPWSRYVEIGGIECCHRLLYTDDKLVMEAIGSDAMIVAPEHASYYRCHPGSESGNPNPEAELAGYKYFFGWLLSKKDRKINKIVHDYLPFHLLITKRFYSPLSLSQHKDFYPLFGITDTSKWSWHWNRFKIRLLTLRTLIHKVLSPAE